MLARLVAKLGVIRTADVYIGPQTADIEEATVTSGFAVRVLENSPDTMSVVFTNSGTEDIYLSLSNKVSAQNGMRLPAGGSPLVFTYRDNQNLPGREWWAMSPTSGSILHTIRCVYVE